MRVINYILADSGIIKTFCSYTQMRVGSIGCTSCRHFSHIQKNSIKREVYCEGDEMYNKSTFYKLLLTEKRESTLL